jgi:hypothetical protein
VRSVLVKPLAVVDALLLMVAAWAKEGARNKRDMQKNNERKEKDMRI